MILETPKRALTEAEILDCVDEALTTIAALAGLFDENFNRGAGWIFYELGRRIERGINTCRLARQFAHQEATEHNLDVLLDLIDSQITYRSRTLIGVALAPVRDMALLDPFNPRSVAFQTKLIDEHIANLPVLRQDGLPEEPLRLATLLQRRTRRRIRRQARGSAHSRDRAAAGGARRGDRGALFPAGRVARARREDHGPRVIYDVIHLTRYRYGAPVAVNACALRLLPREEPGQRVDFRADRGHARSRRAGSERIDPFDNRVARMRIETPHRELVDQGDFARRRSSGRRRRSPR